MSAPDVCSESPPPLDRSSAPSRRADRAPLFSGWWLVAAALATETVLLLWLWPAVAVHGWSPRMLLLVTAIATLGSYIVGETTRRRGRVSLRVWFAALALASVLSSILARQILLGFEQREHVRAIAAHGGFVDYDLDAGYDQRFRTPEGLFLPKWLLSTCGPECFGSAISVTLQGVTCDGDLLRHLAKLPKLRSVSLRESRFARSAFRELVDLPTLDELRLDGSEIAAEDVEVLATMSQLRVLSLRGTKIPATTLERLRAALPNCWIEPR